MEDDHELPAGAEEDEDSTFDLSLKKKKKKKKKLVLEDGEEAEGEGAEDEVVAEVEKLDLDDDSFDFSKKKKKKKSKKLEGDADDGLDLDDDLSQDKKKKSKKKAEDGDVGEEENIYGPHTGEPWDGRDYKYEELLGRVFRILHEHNPELGGQATKTILKPPQVLREGTKKTVFANFADLCKLMHRSHEHVLQFLMAELGTSGSLDGQSRLIIKGRFLPKDFEGVLRRYVNEYVMCNMCKSFDTILKREQRLYILQCNNCGATRSVQAIKSGYQALIGKRSAQRAAAS